MRILILDAFGLIGQSILRAALAAAIAGDR